jgi:hypothetical protein
MTRSHPNGTNSTLSNASDILAGNLMVVFTFMVALNTKCQIYQ